MPVLLKSQLLAVGAVRRHTDKNRLHLKWFCTAAETFQPPPGETAHVSRMSTHRPRIICPLYSREIPSQELQKSPNALATLRQLFKPTILRISCAFSLFQTRQTGDTSRAEIKPEHCGSRDSGARPVRWASSWPVVFPAWMHLYITNYCTPLWLSQIYQDLPVCFIIYENSNIHK